MKSDYQERRVKLNLHVKVTLKSERYKDSDLYRNTITVQSVRSGTSPLNFITRDDLVEAIKKMDLDEEQQRLVFQTDAKE